MSRQESFTDRLFIESTDKSDGGVGGSKILRHFIGDTKGIGHAGKELTAPNKSLDIHLVSQLYETKMILLYV